MRPISVMRSRGSAAVASYIVAHLPLSSDLTDTKGATWTAVGSAVVSGGVLALDGSTQNLTTGNNTDLDFGSADFCIEAFVTVDASGSGERAIFAKWKAGQYSYFMGLNVYGRMAYYLYSGGTGAYPTGSILVPTGVEKHLAWYRVSGIAYVAIEGIVESLGSYASFDTKNTAQTIGATGEANGYLKTAGIREVRVSKGGSPYGSSNFIAPTPPLTDS